MYLINLGFGLVDVLLVTFEIGAFRINEKYIVNG